jgi:hypothetical protein
VLDHLNRFRASPIDLEIAAAVVDQSGGETAPPTTQEEARLQVRVSGIGEPFGIEQRSVSASGVESAT